MVADILAGIKDAKGVNQSVDQAAA